MPSVPAVLLDEVADEPAQTGMATVRLGDVTSWSSPPSAKAASSFARETARRRLARARTAVQGVSSAADVHSQSGSAPSRGVPRCAQRRADQLAAEDVVLDENMMLEQAAEGDGGATDAGLQPRRAEIAGLAAEVVRRRSSAPTRCSTSLPASGGFHGVSLVVIVDITADVSFLDFVVPRNRGAASLDSRAA